MNVKVEIFVLLSNCEAGDENEPVLGIHYYLKLPNIPKKERLRNSSFLRSVKPATLSGKRAYGCGIV